MTNQAAKTMIASSAIKLLMFDFNLLIIPIYIVMK